jgi:hypothetical protein
MSDKHIQPAHQGSAGTQTKKMKITNELVMAISDRIYGMLLRELKVERERQRFLNRAQRR